MVLGEKHFNVKKKWLRDKGEENRIKTKGNHLFAYYISRTTLGYRVHNGQQERYNPCLHEIYILMYTMRTV